MSDLPAVSVIVPARNAERTLADCVDSLLAIDYPRKLAEIIVVDNGSRDGTPAILDGYGDQLRVVHEVRPGRARARNAGLRRSESAVVAFTDADCVVDPGWLRALVGPLADPTVGIAGGAVRGRDPQNRVAAYGERIHDQRAAIELYRPAYVTTACWASPRAILERVGGFDERFSRCEDVDLAYRVSQAGYTLAYADEAVVYHRNAPTLAGLFQEGFRHGVYAVQSNKVHGQWVRAYGHRRLGVGAYFRLASSFRRTLTGPDRATSALDAVFGTAKLLGKVAGSARFGYLDL